MSTHLTPIGALPVSSQHSSMPTLQYTPISLKYTISSLRAFATISGLSRAPDWSSKATVPSCIVYPASGSCRSSLGLPDALPAGAIDIISSRLMIGTAIMPRSLSFFWAATPAHTALQNSRGYTWHCFALPPVRSACRCFSPASFSLFVHCLPTLLSTSGELLSNFVLFAARAIPCSSFTFMP